MIEPRTLKGFRDFLPTEARKRNYVITKLKSVFESFGFEPLETPTLEYEDILAGKYGEEGDKLMYRFEDNGKRRVAMRYDQTVPLARVVAQYKNDLPMPFKRYQIQNVWRAENTQKGRYREFLQSDIDIVGDDIALADAEVIATAARALDTLGFDKYKILINNRTIFNFVNEEMNWTADQGIKVVRAIDKLKKIGRDEVLKEISNVGMSLIDAKRGLEIIETKKPTPRLEETFSILKAMGIENRRWEYLPTLARGMDYYTGLIFEIEIDEYSAGSVGGGGRYNNLIGMYANQKYPAVGFAFGFDRTMEAMEALNLFPDEITEATGKVLVTIFSEETKQKSLEVTIKLREANINTELYLGELKEKNPLEKQLKYANQKNIPYVIVIGPEEVEKNMTTLKNMKTREQQQLSLEDTVKVITQ
ncbi:MAG: histidine--tRNA ligase [Candidatus Levyibacteriota bacterium]